MTLPTTDEIRQARHAAGLTQKQAAALVSRTWRAWQAWELGQNPIDPAAWELFQRKVADEATPRPA